MNRKSCPRCGSNDVWRSRRRGLERAFSFFGLYPFRCERCYARFRRFGRTAYATPE